MRQGSGIREVIGVLGKGPYGEFRLNVRVRIAKRVEPENVERTRPRIQMSLTTRGLIRRILPRAVAWPN